MTDIGRNEIDEDFESLTLGNINGQGSYTHAGTWTVTADSSCSVEVVTGKHLRLTDSNVSGDAEAVLVLDDGYRPNECSFQIKYRHNVTNKTSYFILAASAGGGSPVCGIGFNYTEQIRAWIPGDEWYDLQAYSADAWYTVKIVLSTSEIRFYIDGDLKSTKARSNTDPVYEFYFDTVTNESGVQADFDDLVFVGYPEVTQSDTLSTSDSDSTTKSVSITDSVIVVTSDEARHSSSFSLEPDFRYYFGSYDGKVYAEDLSYKSDDGNTIDCYWISKQADFADQHQICLDRNKTLYKIKIWYVDKSANTNITVKVSTDGGATWTQRVATVGTGSEINKSTELFFIKTGQTFQFKVENDTNSDAFQWTGLEVYFNVCGDYFQI